MENTLSVSDMTGAKFYEMEVREEQLEEGTRDEITLLINQFSNDNNI